MDLFPRSFLLVFAQLAVGGFFALSIPSFHRIERGYYKSTAVIYLVLALLALSGRIALLRRGTGANRELVEVLLWGLFIAAGAGYCATLWGDRFVLRARLFACTWALGFLALVVMAASYCPSRFSLEALVYPAPFVVSALLLGSVCGGMLLGHWYLIDRNLTLSPLRAMLGFYAMCLIAQAVTLAVGGLLLAAAGSEATWRGLQQLVGEHLAFFVARLLVSPLGAGVLAGMIWRTLQIPQTMAATGLFYIAILAVMVGEFMGRYLLFRTGLPL